MKNEISKVNHSTKEMIINKKKKEPSSFTIDKNKEIFEIQDFDNTEDFVNAEKGYIETIKEGIIKDPQGRIVYNINKFDFLYDQEAVDVTDAHPGLWRQGQLNQKNGLFEVGKDQIYQIRNFDLSNMTFIAGNSGWIVVDPLVSEETAAAGFKLLKEHVKIRKKGFKSENISAIIITHSHIDHFGGIEGVLGQTGMKPEIYVPKEFFEHAVSENIMAGNAMSRRASYMYGNLLRKHEHAMIGTGLGQTLSTGKSDIRNGTIIIDNNNDQQIIDGLHFDFIYAPDSEAPAEMLFYIEEYEAFCQAEDINHTLHNLYTLRGAQVRNGLVWSEYIDRAINQFGHKTKVSFGTHHWPTWHNKGKDKENKILKLWKGQRNMYRFIHDQTLRLANKGYTPREIAEYLKLNKSIDQEFANRGYYGSVNHDVKAQYQLYFGWFDGNPANLHKLTPEEAGKKYVDLIGGPEILIEKAYDSIQNGEYRWAAEVLNHLVSIRPNEDSGFNKHRDNAKLLLADAFEQMGYQAESGPWRNFYLTGAQELRYGVLFDNLDQNNGPEMIQHISNKLLFDYISMKFNGIDQEASKMNYYFKIYLKTDSSNIQIEDNISLSVEEGVVFPRIGVTMDHSTPTASIFIKREILNQIVTEKTNWGNEIANGNVNIDGNKDDFLHFWTKIESFDLWFNIVEPNPIFHTT